MKEQILAALNAAGVQTTGLDDAALLAAYNSFVSKPHTERLSEVNAKLATFEQAARNAEAAELDALAAELATNSVLKPDDFKAMGLPRCKELKANAKAAPIVPGGTAQPNEDPFKSYSLNAVIDAAGK